MPASSYKFFLGSRERYIHIDCGFESGNIQLVRQMSEFHVRPPPFSIASAASMMESKRIIGSIPRAGFISVFMASLKIPKENSQLVECRHSWQSMYPFGNIVAISKELPSRLPIMFVFG